MVGDLCRAPSPFRRKLFWTGSMESMESLAMEQGSASQHGSATGALSLQSSPASSAVAPKSPVLLAAKRLAFELDQLAEVRPCSARNTTAIILLHLLCYNLHTRVLQKITSLVRCLVVTNKAIQLCLGTTACCATVCGLGQGLATACYLYLQPVSSTLM